MAILKKQLINPPIGRQNGFTLIEVLVSTAIFVIAMSAMLAMFNYTLQINRRVQALREVVQGTRTFAETITREIRNGRIDYSSWTTECKASNYKEELNQSLSIITKTGEKLCFYFNEKGQMFLKKQTPSGEVSAPIFNSDKFSILKDNFSFIVMPKTDPNEQSDPNTGGYPKIQPFVTIAGQFILNDGSADPTNINYQTTISTDVYDIRK